MRCSARLVCPFGCLPKALAAGKLGTCVTISSTEVIRSLNSEDDNKVRVGQIGGAQSCPPSRAEA